MSFSCNVIFHPPTFIIMGLIGISGGICLFQRFSPAAIWSHLFSNINRKMEFAQEDCSEDGDDGGCEPSMVSTVLLYPVYILNRPFMCTENIQISNALQGITHIAVYLMTFFST
jgi:hypothetical protein